MEQAPKLADLSYLITIGRTHLMPSLMLMRTLRHVTSAEIVAVGNLTAAEARQIAATGAHYFDESDIDLSGRMPVLDWDEKYRNAGWYRQQMIRLCADRFMTSEQIVVLDSEVFAFANWDERRFFDPSGNPKCLYWVPAERKPEWDYRMYRGAAFLLQFLDGCHDVMEYANSSEYRRHISGVVLFSRRNIEYLWARLGRETDLETNLIQLFNREPSLSFSEFEFYGIAADLGLFDNVVPTTSSNELLGWYDNHDDPAFHGFKADAMWSMCQRYADYPAPTGYLAYMRAAAASLDAELPDIPYWNPLDRPAILPTPDDGTATGYFSKYTKQLNFTDHTRSSTMRRSLDLVNEAKPTEATVVEIGTLRDGAVGGGHSTFKFGEYCSRTGGIIHSVDISPEAIAFSQHASADFLPWIRHHLADSTDFLRSFDGVIDLLYLDGFDSTPGNEQQASEKQLSEISAALPLLAPRCVVLLDDANLPDEGKVRLSAPFLLANGFSLVESNYQLLFARGLPPARRSLYRRVRSLGGRVLRRLKLI